MFGLIAAAAIALSPAAPSASAPSTVATAETPASPAAAELRRYPAPEAKQGVAVDARFLYVVDDSQIGKYDKATGRKVAEWTGDPARFPHLNSCEIIGKELVCASSNYPQTPMTSSVEIFDPVRMTHLRSIAPGSQPGSLTWVDRKDGAWWAGFANYDGRGGVPGHDHRETFVVKFDDAWRPLGQWSFPSTVLDRFAPSSSSGAGWSSDGLLYVTGHTKPELYVMRLPRKGTVLEHVATVEVPIEGQAIAWDRSQPRVLFGIVRSRREVVEMKVPALRK